MKYLIILSILLLQSCTISVKKKNAETYPADETYQPEEEKSVKIETGKFADNDRFYKIMVIDQCEYILISGYHETTICHKGNCSNPVHRDNSL